MEHPSCILIRWSHGSLLGIAGPSYDALYMTHKPPNSIEDLISKKWVLKKREAKSIRTLAPLKKSLRVAPEFSSLDEDDIENILRSGCPSIDGSHGSPFLTQSQKSFQTMLVLKAPNTLFNTYKDR